MTFIKRDLIVEVSIRTGLKQKQAEDAYEAITSRIAQALMDGHRVEVEGLGIFRTVVRKGHEGTNLSDPSHPRVWIPEHKKVLFELQASLKKQLNPVMMMERRPEVAA